MRLFEFIADVSGLTNELRTCGTSLTRIAEAMERLSPPLPAAPPPSADRSEVTNNRFYVSESGSEYESRLSHESALAESLGVAAWSPAFQRAVSEMRDELRKPRMETNEEGIQVARGGYTEEEADQIVRDAFRLAQAEANVRDR